MEIWSEIFILSFPHLHLHLHLFKSQINQNGKTTREFDRSWVVKKRDQMPESHRNHWNSSTRKENKVGRQKPQKGSSSCRRIWSLTNFVQSGNRTIFSLFFHNFIHYNSDISPYQGQWQTYPYPMEYWEHLLLEELHHHHSVWILGEQE